MTDEQYEDIKRCVSGPGWDGAVIFPSDMERFEPVGCDYFKSLETIKRLTADGILIKTGLLRWRRADTSAGGT